MCLEIRMRKNAKKIEFLSPRMVILFNINVNFSFRPIPIS